MSKLWEPETRDVIGRLRSAVPTYDERPRREWQLQLRLRELGKMLGGALLLGSVFLVGALGMTGTLELGFPLRAEQVQIVTDLAPDPDPYAEARFSRAILESQDGAPR